MPVLALQAGDEDSSDEDEEARLQRERQQKQDAYRQKTIDMELAKLTGIKGVAVPNRPAPPQSPGLRDLWELFFYCLGTITPSKQSKLIHFLGFPSSVWRKDQEGHSKRFSRCKAEVGSGANPEQHIGTILDGLCHSRELCRAWVGPWDFVFVFYLFLCLRG